METTVNDCGVRVKRACCSCAFKELTRLVTLRLCRKHGRKVKPGDVCDDWRMSEVLRRLTCR